MTIRLIYSEQYRKPCVVALPTDAADDVITACHAGGAVNYGCDICDGAHAETYVRESTAVNGQMYHVRRDGSSDHEAPCYPELHEYIVQLRDDVGPELWTEAALRRSLGRRI